LKSDPDLAKKQATADAVKDPTAKLDAEKPVEQKLAEEHAAEPANVKLEGLQGKIKDTNASVEKLDNLVKSEQKRIAELRKAKPDANSAEAKARAAKLKSDAELEPRLKSAEVELEGLKKEAAAGEKHANEVLGDKDFHQDDLIDEAGATLDEIKRRADERVKQIQGPADPAADFDVKKFNEEKAHLGTNERVALIEKVARERAERLGFRKDNRISVLNQRTVFVDPATGNLFSVDTENGRFEKCNPRGEHIEEVDFNLKNTKPRDETGGHDLRI